MTRSRVSGSRLSSARPLRTRETVEAWTFAARATSVIVTRLAANRSPPAEIDCFYRTIRSAPDLGCAVRQPIGAPLDGILAVDLLAQPIGRKHVDVAQSDADQPAVLEVGEHLVHRDAC